MSKYRSTRVSTEFLKTLEGKISLFYDQEPALFTGQLADIAVALRTACGLPVICMHWGELSGPVGSCLHEGAIVLPVSRSFTNTLVRLGKLLADRQYIVLVHDFDEIAFTVDRKPFFRFVAVLTEKCRERHSTLLTTSGRVPGSPGYEVNISRLFDNRFLIDTNGLHRIGTDKDTENNCTLFGDTLHQADTDMEKIREIFRLTPEEQEELNIIASRQIRDLNIN